VIPQIARVLGCFVADGRASLFDPLCDGFSVDERRVEGGFLAWWVRRTYYLFQMPRWDRRVRIVLDWTVALFFRPDVTRVDLRVEREQVTQARQLVERSSEKARANV